MGKYNVTSNEIARRNRYLILGAAVGLPVVTGVLEGILERQGMPSTGDTVNDCVDGVYTLAGTFLGAVMSQMPLGPKASGDSNKEKFIAGSIGAVVGGLVSGAYSHFIQKGAKALTLALYR